MGAAAAHPNVLGDLLSIAIGIALYLLLVYQLRAGAMNTIANQMATAASGAEVCSATGAQTVQAGQRVVLRASPANNPSSRSITWSLVVAPAP